MVGTPPVATITAPADGTVFNAGDTITITGSATDPDGGVVPASSLAWNIQFLHNDHAHPGATGTGSSITFPIPRTGHDYSGDTRYRVELTATDADGLTTSTSIILRPNKTTVVVSSNQATTMTVDNVTQNLPFGIDTVVGFQHSVSVPATQCVLGRVWNFSSWSDGGARTHTITVATGQSLARHLRQLGDLVLDDRRDPLQPQQQPGEPADVAGRHPPERHVRLRLPRDHDAELHPGRVLDRPAHDGDPPSGRHRVTRTTWSVATPAGRPPSIPGPSAWGATP